MGHNDNILILTCSFFSAFKSSNGLKKPKVEGLHQPGIQLVTFCPDWQIMCGEPDLVIHPASGVELRLVVLAWRRAAWALPRVK